MDLHEYGPFNRFEYFFFYTIMFAHLNSGGKAGLYLCWNEIESTTHSLCRSWASMDG